MKRNLMFGKKRSAALYKQPRRVYGRSLFGTDIVVISEKDLFGQFGIPLWQRLKEPKPDYWLARHLKYQLIPSLYWVYRQALEILINYGISFNYGEKAKMLAAVAAADDISQTVVGLRKGNLNVYKKTLQKRVEAIFNLVGPVTNPTKSEAVLQFKPIAQAKDSLGRVNIGVMSARSVAGRTKFKERFVGEIAFIEPKIVARLKAAEIALDYVEYLLFSAIHFLSEIIRYTEKRRMQISKKAKERIIRRLAFIVSDLEQIVLQPFWVNFYLCTQEMKNAIFLLRQDKTGMAVDLIKRSYNSLLLKEIQSDLEDIILEITLRIAFQDRSPEVDLFRRVDNLCYRANTIDELGFIRYCSQAVSNLLRLALVYIEDKKYKLVKDVLKEASIELSKYN